MNLLEFKKGLCRNNNNTYKFALALALLKHSKANPTVSNISYDFIFESFIEFYWNQVTLYKIKHSVTSKQEPLMISKIKKFCEDNELWSLNYKRLKRVEAKKYNILLESLKGTFNDLINNPLSRIHSDYRVKNQSGGDPEGIANLYSWSREKQTLKLSNEGNDFLVNNYDSIYSLVLLECAKFLEKYNLTPRLISKIDSEAERESFSKAIKDLFEYKDEDRCFYCDVELSSENTEIEHFIPHEFVLEHAQWNLVKSCSDCNRGRSGKHNRLPRKSLFLNKLIDRNICEFDNGKYALQNYFESIEDMDNKIRFKYAECLNAGFKVWWEGPSNYSLNAKEYISETIDVDMSSVYEPFEKLIKKRGRILDLGSGSGRDSKYFLSKGNEVKAIEPNIELFEASTREIGEIVEHISIQEFQPNKEFDAIWACASLLHLTDEELVEVFGKFKDVLKADGHVYMSFKQGTYKGIKSRRYFNYHTVSSLKELLPGGYEVVKNWESEDLRNSTKPKWLNVIVKLSSS